jgi:hypothetical protein
MPWFRFAFRQTLAISAGLLTAGVATAQTPAPRPAVPAARAAALAAPPRSPASPTDYDIKGFRSAMFGHTPAQVRMAIAADFGQTIKITETSNPAEGTQVLQVTVPRIDPGPGAATVTYIFGASSKTLQHVNVVWVLDGEPTAEQRAGILTAAGQLANYFQTLPSPPKTVAGPAATGPNGLLVFAGADRKGASVEVVADGITYQATQDNKPFTSPTPKGPAVLRVSYILNPTNPDIFKIKPGSF